MRKNMKILRCECTSSRSWERDLAPSLAAISRGMRSEISFTGASMLRSVLNTFVEFAYASSSARTTRSHAR